MTFISLLVWLTAIVGCQPTERGGYSSPALNTHIDNGAVQGAASSSLRVIIYYFHPTLRCASCLLAESLAHQVVEEQWKDAVDQGILQWRLANIDLPENRSLTRLFEVDSSAVVVAAVRDGRPVRWEKITQVWELVQEADAFRDRIHGQIMKFLSEE